MHASMSSRCILLAKNELCAVSLFSVSLFSVVQVVRCLPPLCLQSLFRQFATEVDCVIEVTSAYWEIVLKILHCNSWLPVVSNLLLRFNPLRVFVQVVVTLSANYKWHNDAITHKWWFYHCVNLHFLVRMFEEWYLVDFATDFVGIFIFCVE